MTNFDEGCINRISRQMQKYIIYIYEKMLNGKVVSCGQVFLDIGGLTFQIVHDNEDSSRDRAIDKFIDHFRKTAKFRDLAKVIVVAGRTNITSLILILNSYRSVLTIEKFTEKEQN